MKALLALLTLLAFVASSLAAFAQSERPFKQGFGSITGKIESGEMRREDPDDTNGVKTSPRFSSHLKVTGRERRRIALPMGHGCFKRRVFCSSAAP